MVCGMVEELNLQSALTDEPPYLGDCTYFRTSEGEIKFCLPPARRAYNYYYSHRGT